MLNKSIRPLAMLIFCLAAACSLEEGRQDNSSSPFTVQSSGIILPSLIQTGDQERALDESAAPPFQAIVEHAGDGIPYVSLGGHVELRLGQEVSAVYEITDYILTENGSYKYRLPEQQPSEVEFSGGQGTFTLEANLAAYLSSNTKDYEPGATIRGFKLTGTTDGETQEYYFVIRTDAMPKPLNL